jgi:N-acyl-D-amino-acid deacylase
VLILVEQGKLKLSDRALDYLPDIQPGDGKQIEPRFREVTIEQLLRHTGGWDRDRSFDPMFRPKKIADELGIAAPADSTAVVRYMLGRPLDFTPGERYSYSNFGYCVLGRIIERVTGESYEAAIRRLVLEPCGAHSMRIGRTRREGSAPGEVCYYMPGDEKKTQSVYPDVTEEVAWPDGGFYLEAMDAHGGWIGSAIDLLRFTAALDGKREPRLLKPESVEQMTSRGAHTPASDKTFYAHGWMVRPLTKRANWWHAGSLPGTSTLLVHTADGFDWAVLLNARPADVGINEFHAALDAIMWQALQEVKSWPEHDLFLRNSRPSDAQTEPSAPNAAGR